MAVKFPDFGGWGRRREKANLKVSSLDHWVDGNAMI